MSIFEWISKFSHPHNLQNPFTGNIQEYVYTQMTDLSLFVLRTMNQYCTVLTNINRFALKNILSCKIQVWLLSPSPALQWHLAPHLSLHWYQAVSGILQYLFSSQSDFPLAQHTNSLFYTSKPCLRSTFSFRLSKVPNTRCLQPKLQFQSS